MTEETQVTLTRTGKPPLRFTAVADWHEDDRVSGGQDSTRWTEVSIYKTKGGRLVAASVHRTKWEGEHERRLAASFETAAELVAWFAEPDGIPVAAQRCLEAAAKQDGGIAAAYGEDVP